MGVLLALVQSFASAEVYFEWKEGARHSYCDSAFKAGHESDGRPLHVSQAKHSVTAFGPSVSADGNSEFGLGFIFSSSESWHIGKAGKHLKEGMVYSYDGKEKDVGSFSLPGGNSYEHHVLCLTEYGKQHIENIRWVPPNTSNIPAGSIRGFNGNERQYVCRVKHNGGYHPGKLIAQNGSCFFGYGGKEIGSKQYEVLTIDPDAEPSFKLAAFYRCAVHEFRNVSCCDMLNDDQKPEFEMCLGQPNSPATREKLYKFCVNDKGIKCHEHR